MFPYKTPAEFSHALKSNSPRPSCPVATTINLLSGKWELNIIYQLFVHDTLRFGQLRKLLPGITNTMLTKVLQKFISAGIVSRMQYNEIPPHVEYSLTEKGRQLNIAFFELAKWAEPLSTGTIPPSFTIRKITENKKQYLSLLLLADEQESMIDRYLNKGTMYVLDDDGIKAECVVTDEGNGILEIKNIATAPEYQGKSLLNTLLLNTKIPTLSCRLAPVTAPSPFPSTKNAALSVTISSKTFSRTTTTTLYLSAVSSWWI